MLIRPEQVSDYADIGALHARAFGNRSLEAVIVMLLRQRRAFDPELSLVAEENGQIIGHVLFSPYQMRLLGQTLPIVNLAPLAVDPVYQRRGVGGQLIIKGHAIAATRGYALSILLGHSSYYRCKNRKLCDHHALESTSFLRRDVERIASTCLG